MFTSVLICPNMHQKTSGQRETINLRLTKGRAKANDANLSYGVEWIWISLLLLSKF
jgi:hypothetical protein